MDVSLSVVICTRNRAEYLRKALASLLTQSLPRDRYEVIVVDNASTDETRQVVGEFEANLGVRYVYEPVPGLSGARNTGWSAAVGKYVAYLDDDAVAYPEWTASILDTFVTFQPTPSSVGGRCVPIWEAPRPDWLADGLLGHLAVFDWADERAVLKPGQWVAGANLAFTREVLEEVGGFPEHISRLARRILGTWADHLREQDDIYLREQLDRRGLVTVYDPMAVVGHHISAARLTRDWFKDVTRSGGLSEALMFRLLDHPSVRVRLLESAKTLLWALPRAALMLVSLDRAARFRRECQVLEATSYVSGMWARPRQPAQNIQSRENVAA